MCEYLNACGIKTTHQKAFKHEYKEPQWTGQKGDVSYEAVPFLQRGFDYPLTKILVLRNPLEVVRSWLELGAFGEDFFHIWPFWAAALEYYCPEVLQQETSLDKAAWYWLEWNLWAMPLVDHTFNLESMQVKDLLNAIGYTGEPAYVQTIDRNERTADKVVNLGPLTLDQFSDRTAARLKNVGSTMGYEL